jgi:uncharacterized protein (UPF0276 family)
VKSSSWPIGILLDVNNIYVSSQNHNFDPYDYLNNIPHHRVGQIHCGPFQIRKVSSTPDHGSGPGLEDVWSRDQANRSHRHIARVG